MSEIVHKFTRNVPNWRPRVKPLRLADATPEQLDALKVTPSNTKISDYVLVLAHDVESLSVRSPLFNNIMYDSGGMSRAEREIGAIAASIVNRCVYCAAVHASRHAQLERSTDATDAIFRNGENAQLAPRDQAIFNFALKLSTTPVEAGPDDLAQLQNAGLDNTEVLDLVLSTALFGWANRLMHVLGDPIRKES